MTPRGYSESANGVDGVVFLKEAFSLRYKARNNRIKSSGRIIIPAGRNSEGILRAT